MEIRHIKISIVDIPQVSPIAPYRSHIRSSSTTTSGIVEIMTESGLTGLGEFNLNFLPGLDLQQMQESAQWVVGRQAHNIEGFHQECPLETRLKSGIEIAMWDVAGKAAGVPVAMLLGGIRRPRVELAACMGIQSYERAGEIASLYVEQGFTTLKTKAGSDMEEDLEMVRGIRDAVGMKLKLRIDPNRAYSLGDALQLCQRLEQYELEYLEQPIPAEPLAEAVALRDGTSVPIALNESVIGPDSAWEILHQGASELLLPDTHIAGGILPCVKIGHLAESAGATCIMHCGHDLGPKTAAMVHVAAACESYRLGNDTTYYGLEDDIIAEPILISAGYIAVPDAPGLGIEVDQEKMARYTISPGR
jgi:L-alanine-DL-glutamate epimerase-like enolase superfamily enzyme